LLQRYFSLLQHRFCLLQHRFCLLHLLFDLLQAFKGLLQGFEWLLTSWTRQGLQAIYARLSCPGAFDLIWKLNFSLPVDLAVKGKTVKGSSV
jgi:hypothetical protein